MTTRDAATRRTFVLRTLVPGVILLALSCALGSWILVRGNSPFLVDASWNTLLLHWDSTVMLVFARVMNVLGGTWFGVFVVPLACALGLLLSRRPWAAVYFLAASIASAACVQVLKHLFGRARPEEIIVVSDYGSYPSGHVANAATIGLVLVVLFPRLWTAVVASAWVALMALSRTYLHAHWASDTLGGALAGVGAGLVVAAAFAAPLLRERTARHTAAVP